MKLIFTGLLMILALGKSLAANHANHITHATGGRAAARDEYIPDPGTLNKKVMFGYQGWHATPHDGSGVGMWRHWFNRNASDSAYANFDVWPDMREYPKDVQEATSMSYPDGSEAMLYSAYKAGAVNLHFKWMKEHNLDGVFEQRFIGDVSNAGGRRHFNQVVRNVRAASEKYNRVFCIMYDISGAGPQWKERLLNDWKFLVDSLGVTKSKRYLHHKGRPLLAIWGIGFDHTGFATSAQTDSLLDWFHKNAEKRYQATIMGGVNDNWLTHSADWKAVYNNLDVLSPWAVGRYHDNITADQFRNRAIIPDKAYCDLHQVAYMPVIFPGFSWYNLRHGHSPFNQIPRLGGSFFWHQAYNAINAKVSMVYIAMFDEVDEGTAMYKLAPTAAFKPVRGKFLSADQDGEALPSDWYLTLADAVGQMLRGERPLTQTIPADLKR